MIQPLGSCNVNNIHCKYHFIGNKLFLIPVNENEISVLNQYFYNNNSDFVEIPISYSEGKSDFIYYSQYHPLFGGISLEVTMYFEFYTNIDVKGMVITSDAINFYVNPAEHFYVLKTSDGFTEPELLYKSEGIHDFIFTFNGIKVESKFVIGGILQRGIASDMKLNSKLELSFPPTNDREFIIKLLYAVKKCFKFAIYNDDVIFNRIELLGDSDRRSFCGSITINENRDNVSYKGISFKSNYYWLKDYLGQFFEIVSNDKNLYSAHLNNTYTHYLNSNEIRFANIFAAFETEYGKMPKEIRFKDTTSIEPFRNRLVDIISEVEVSNIEEKVFLEQLVSKTKELGKLYGSKMKILIAIEYVKDCIQSSLKTFRIDEKQINYYSKHIPEIRNKIVHNNYKGDIGDQLGVSLIEWVTYAMFLKRVGLPSKSIEYILGRIFYSNALEL